MYLFDIYPSELPRSVFCCLTLSGGNSQSLLQIVLMFLLFFSFWSSHYPYVTPFAVIPQFLNILFFFFFSIFFLLLFSFVSLSWHVLKFRGSFFSHVSLQISRLKPTFTSIIVFLISSISLWFLKFSSLCLCYPSVIACCLLFSTKKLNVFIIVILNCQSDNSNMSAISDSGFDICSVSLSCFLIF